MAPRRLIGTINGHRLKRILMGHADGDGGLIGSRAILNASRRCSSAEAKLEYRPDFAPDRPKLPEGLPKGLKRAEAHSLGLVNFQDRKLGKGEVNPLSQFSEADHAFRYDPVKIELDRHGLNDKIVFDFQVQAMVESLADDQDQQAGHETLDEE